MKPFKLFPLRAEVEPRSKRPNPTPRRRLDHIPPICPTVLGGLSSLSLSRQSALGVNASGALRRMPPRRLSQSPDAFRPSWPASGAWGGVRDGAGTALAPSSFRAPQIAAPGNPQARAGESTTPHGS